jgi:hypothetical protein
MSDHRIGEVPDFGDWIDMYEGIGLNPEEIHNSLSDLVGQADRHAETLPGEVRDDVGAVLAEMEVGRGRSREVSARLARIRRTAGATTRWAAVGRAAATLETALGLDP